MKCFYLNLSVQPQVIAKDQLSFGSLTFIFFHLLLRGKIIKQDLLNSQEKNRVIFFQNNEV